MDKRMICSSCGSIGAPVVITKGSFLIEVILWLTFLVPGLIYTIWRTTAKETVCAVCRKPTVVGIETPMGQKLQRDLARPAPTLEKSEPPPKVAPRKADPTKRMGRAIW